jgi:hypothetical protein
MPAPAPADRGPGGGGPGKGPQRLNKAPSVGTNIFSNRLISELSDLYDALTPVIRVWLTERPLPEAQAALIENIDSLFWLLQEDYLPSAEDMEADLLEQLSSGLQAAALSLSELPNSDRRSKVQDLADAHNRLRELHNKLKECLRNSRRSSA